MIVRLPCRVSLVRASTYGCATLLLLLAPGLASAQQSNPSAATGTRAAAPHVVPAAPATGDEAVAAVVRAVFAAGERNDLAALDTLYAGDSLTVVEGAGINRGWADYRDHHLAPEMKEMKNFRYRPFEIEARSSGNLAWAIFRYALQAEVEGKAIDHVGRGTAILERRGPTWVVRHTQTTSRARRAGDPPMPQ